METTYTVTGANTSVMWKFTYDAAGHLRAFEFIDGALDQKQIDWLFTGNRFPYSENRFKSILQPLKNFVITQGEPDLSFESFWNAYGKKEKKLLTERAWKKISDVDKIGALRYIKRYNQSLKQSNGIAKQYPDTYLNQKRWLDEQ